MKEGDKERFYAKVQTIPETGCWIWISATVDGYGVFYLAGRQVRAHRLAWEMAGRELPQYPEMVLDHICRERSCVNPDHLRAVTNRQNIIENSASRAAVNARKTHCPKGHAYSRVNGSGSRVCKECARIGYHEVAGRKQAVCDRVRRVRAENIAAGLTADGNPRKNKGYGPSLLTR